MAGTLMLSGKHTIDIEDQKVVSILTKVETIALIGASNKTERDSFKVMSFLLDEGYQVFPVNPALVGEKILNREVYGCIEDIPTSIDMVEVFRQSKYLYDIVVQAKQANAKFIWAQLGVTDTKAELFASESNIPMVVNRCPAIEIPRLGI